MRLLAILCIVPVALAGCLEDAGSVWDGWFGGEEPDPEVMALMDELATFPEWRIETDYGTMRAILYTGWLPVTTDHIIELTEQEFYDGTLFYRVVDDFVIQAGDSTCSRPDDAPSSQQSTCTGEGGSGENGASNEIPLEIYEGLDFGSGAVGLARWTNDTGDSQFFITEKPAIHLSRPETSTTGAVFGAYSLFAQVFDGQDAVRRISNLPVNCDENPSCTGQEPGAHQPLRDVIVDSIQVLDPPTDVDLLNLIPDVHADVSTQGYDGTLEVPRIVVTDHATPILFTTDTPESDDGGPALPANPATGNQTQETSEEPDCDVVSFVVRAPEGAATFVDWTKNTFDPCTFEATLTFDEPGEYVIDLGVDEITVDVRPWHDAYASYAG